MKEDILQYETVALDDEHSALLILDQTKLPGTVEILRLYSQEDIWEAIYLLKVRGAPAIGVAAAIGVNLAAKAIRAEGYDEFFAQFQMENAYLAPHGRPRQTSFGRLTGWRASYDGIKKKTPQKSKRCCARKRSP